MSRRHATAIAAAALGAAVVTSFAAPTPVRAAEEGGVAYAIQPRKFLLSHEFAFNVGVLPMDAFYKGVALGAAYTYHFGEALAWEVLQGTYSLNVSTGLLRRLRNEFAVEPIPEPKLQFLATSSVIFKPFFGKFALANRKIVYLELFFTLGGGIAKTTSVGILPVIDIGAALRFFAWKHISFRLDARDYLALDGLNLIHYLCFTIGISPAFGDIRAGREAKKAAAKAALMEGFEPGSEDEGLGGGK